MRKVTATAVILTALTGCSQSSGIPSTQWSFKVPSVGETSSQPANADADKESSADSGLSQKTQMFANHAGNSRMMGPAFEQPDAEALAKASNLGRPGSQEASSSLSASLANGLAATQTSTRPDPVAQVRAYLNASSPIALTNRTPYSSQVYLSSAPAADSSFVPSVPSLDYLSIAQLGLDSPAVREASNGLPANGLPANGLPANSLPARPEPATAYSSLPVAEASPVAEALPAQNSSSSVAVSPEAYSAGYPNAGATSRLNDGLPQLAASVPSTYTVLPSDAAQAETALPETSQPEAVQTEAVQAEAVQTEADAIGTAILRNLQRSSSAETAADITTSNTTPVIASPASVTVAPAQSAPLPAFSPSAMAALPPQLANLLPSETAGGRATQAYANSEPATYSEPATLVRLTQTMPDREASPLVDSFRAGNGLAELPQPLEALPLSLQGESLGESLAPASTPDNSRIEADLRSSEASPSLPSPLLEGLRIERESSPQSTIYVPIAAAAPVNSSNVLISGATDTLGTEVSTSAFTDELARSNLFSSVLSSPALLASANAPNFDIFSKPGLAELTLQQATIRQDKITVAAHQASKRRQRLTWL